MIFKRVNHIVPFFLSVWTMLGELSRKLQVGNAKSAVGKPLAIAAPAMARVAGFDKTAASAKIAAGDV
jgi:hypothetical protein